MYIFIFKILSFYNLNDLRINNFYLELFLLMIFNFIIDSCIYFVRIKIFWRDNSAILWIWKTWILIVDWFFSFINSINVF